MSQTAVETDLDTLAAFPAALQQQLHGHSDTALRHRPAGEWSSIENVGHLIDIEAIWMGRFQQMLSTENPTFLPADVDEMVRQHDYQHKDLANLLHTFAELRVATIGFLRGLKPLHLERPGIHPLRGPMTVASGIGIMANHDRLHSAQIAKTLADYKT